MTFIRHISLLAWGRHNLPKLLVCLILIAFTTEAAVAKKGNAAPKTEGKEAAAKAPSPLKIKEDSIAALLPNMKGKEKINTLRNLFQLAVKQNDEKRQLEWLDKMKEEARVQKDDSAYSFAGISKIGVLYNYGHTDEVLDSVPPYMEEMKKMKFFDRYYFAWSIMCDVHFFRGQYFHTMRMAMTMHKDAVENNSDIGLAWASWELGQVYYGMKALEPAYEHIKKAVQLLNGRKEKDYGTVSRAFNRYCGLLDNIINQKAKENKENGDLEKESRAAIADWGKCIDEWEQSLKNQGLATTATIFHRLSYYKCRIQVLMAEKKYEEAEKIIEESENMVSGMSSLINSKVIDMKLVYNSGVGNYPAAIKLVDEIIEQGQKRKRNTMLSGDQLTKVSMLVRMGDYADASDILVKALGPKDSINNATMVKSISEINALFQLDEKTAAEARDRLAQRQKGVLTAVLAALLVAATLSVYFLSRRRMLKKLKVSHQQLLDANEDLKLANIRIMEADRMKEMFMLHMGQEVRKPLGDITKFIKQINSPSDTMTAEERAEMLESIQHSTESITTTVNQLLELSDVESKGFLERHDDITPAELCEKAVKAVRPENHKGVEFIYIPEKNNNIRIRTNANYAVKLLSYMINNAYTQTESGTITLKCRQEDSGDMAFTVSDTGVGIPEDRRDHIFETEVEGNEFNKPSDIILCVCKNIAKRLGGDVVLDSSGEGGSVFTITLPVNGSR